MEGDPYSRYSTTHYDYGRWYYEKNKNSNRQIITNPEVINDNNNNNVNIENQIPVQEEQNNQNEIKNEREAVNS